MPKALVTALVPVKAFHPRYLEKAIGSLLDQDDDNWLALVVADEPEAPEVEAALGEALRDPRISLVVSEGVRLAGALNTGMRRATTDFAAILLGDDLWAPETVRVLTAAIEQRSDGDFFHSARAVIDEEDRRISSVYPARDSFSVDDFADGSPVKHLLCWRRELGLSVGGVDETLEEAGTDDWDFPWTMAEADARFVAVPECLYLYRDHRDCFRLTTHVPLSRCLRAQRRVRRKHGVGRLRTERAVLVARRGYLRQCLYRNVFDRWLTQKLGRDSRRGRRLRYS